MHYTQMNPHASSLLGVPSPCTVLETLVCGGTAYVFDCLVINDAAAAILSQLLRLKQLERLEMSCIVLVGMDAWLSTCDAIAFSPLHDVGFNNIGIEEGMSDFYRHLGYRLPEMKCLENLNLFMRRGQVRQHEVDENSQLAIL